MPVGTLLADFRLHLGGPRTMKAGDIRFLLRLGLHLVFFRFRTGGFLEDHAACQNLFYIHNFSSQKELK